MKIYLKFRHLFRVMSIVLMMKIEARVSDLSKDYTKYNKKLFEAKKSFIEMNT